MSSKILEMIAGQLDENALRQISKQLGADEEGTQKAVTAALPLLLNALDREAAEPEGAQALANALRRDHSGNILQDVTAALANDATRQDGEAILGHVLGSRRSSVEKGLGQVAGLDPGSTGQLLSMLAPLVMGALGRVQQEEDLDAGGVSNFLTREREETDSELSGVARLLDLDGDGNVSDDLLNIGSNLLGGFFKKR